MIPSITMRRLALLALFMLATALNVLAADPRYIPPTKKPSATKLESDRKAAESKRKFEQTKRDMQSAQQRIKQKAFKDIAAARERVSSRSAPPFDPVGAPPPEEAFQAFLSAAKSASSMDQLLPYLPQREQEI